jgi:hypothetical protein
MTDKPSTIVTMLLDRSGSMGAVRDATIEAFNAYLAGLKAEHEATILLNHIQFDSIDLIKVHTAAPISGVPDLTRETYKPQGGTPLIDAACKTIHAVAAQVSDRPDTKVVICIQTDGEENCSREFGWAQLVDLVKEKTALGWQFNFLGAGLDAYAQGSKMGIAAGSTMSYDHRDPAATRAAFTASAANAADFGAGRLSTTEYSLGQRTSARDAFVPADLAASPSPPPAQTPPAPAPRKVVDDLVL